jgi:hypothetical protein
MEVIPGGLDLRGEWAESAKIRYIIEMLATPRGHQLVYSSKIQMLYDYFFLPFIVNQVTDMEVV